MNHYHIHAPWTSESKYYIDFDRGTVIHSRMANKSQGNKVFCNVPASVIYGHLTYNQRLRFWKSYQLG
jgi:hypothetical protein